MGKERVVSLALLTLTLFVSVGAQTQSAVCPRLLILNETSGVITSPFYPSNYPNYAHCSWQITASKGKRIKLVIEDMHTEGRGNCPYDYLQIQNGSPSGDGAPYGRMCGRLTGNVTFFSFREILNVLFVTDDSATYRGFKATYTHVNFTGITYSCTSEGFLTGSSGFFSSPNFPNNYPQYSSCTWNITVPRGHIIKVSFLHFELEPYQYIPCHYKVPGSRVTITNVASDDGYQQFLLCGQRLPSPVYSVGNSIQVTFTSLTNQYSGFNASYMAVTYQSVCPNLITLNETSGVITSPFYPRTYPNNLTCSWQITASKGKHIVLIIEFMYIQQCGSSCTCDYIEIQNGFSSDGTSSKRRCDYLRVSYFSLLESLNVLFVSDGSVRYRGFKATYTQVNYTAETTACTSGDFLNGSSGFFSTPNFPNHYTQYSRCTWNITVPSGYIIKVSFLHFELDGYPHRDRVTITNVASDDGNQPFQLFGQSLPSPVYSVGNFVQVIFTSLANQYSGFNATYTAITYESVCPNLITLNDTSGVITSPFYPRIYPNNQICSWQITTSKGKHIVLIIEFMYIEHCGSSCTCDYLEIRNGLSSDGALSRRRCGNLRVSYLSLLESLNVLFVSDGSWRLHGFKATYSQVNYTAETTACTSSGDFLNGSSGFFSTPNFSNHYTQYSICTWNITVPSGYIIKVSFLHFQLDGYPYRDRVTITNVASDDGNQPFQLRGQSLPSPVYSVGNSVQVTLLSFTNQHSGFNATYAAISYESVCPNLLTLNESSGVITSPFYPSNYPNSQACSWEITASKGKCVKLVVEDINIESGVNCPYDYLQIQNFSSAGSGAVSGRICGIIDKVTYYSSNESLKVLFLSDDFERFRGFNATYSQVNCTSFGPIFPVSITSPGSPVMTLSSTEKSLSTTTAKIQPTTPISATATDVSSSPRASLTSTPASASSSDAITASLIPTEMPVEEKFKASIALDENYLFAYNNLSSTESRAFIRNFTSKVEYIFRARLSNFIRVEVTGLSNGSVVVDFDIVVDKSLNATKSNIITALRDSNKTGALGYRLTGDITVKEVQGSSTVMVPSTFATEAELETTTEITTQPTTHINKISNITITEEDNVILNCTMDYFDGKHVWTREDGTAAETTTRVLTKDTQLEIKHATISDAGVYICKNGQLTGRHTATHRFIVRVEVFVKVQMIVKVLNYEYTPELKNKSSEIYKATEKNFTAEMDKVYKNTPGYKRTEVLNFTKGSVNVDFRVIIVIVASDPKNASKIPDAKAKTAQRVVLEAKDGLVNKLRVSPNVEVFSPPPDPRGVEIFGIKSDELSVRWKPPEDSDTFKVLEYHVQHKEFNTRLYISVSFPATKGKNTYSYRIQNLEAETTYLVRVGAENKHGPNFNEAQAHETDPAPFAKWIIVLIVLAIIFVLGIIVGLIVCKRRRSEHRRRRLEEEQENRFGGLIGDVRMEAVSHYEDKNVKGLKFSYENKSFKPSDVNWKEIPYEKLTLMNELGSGAFGVVYKGELKRENGDVTPCAVKSLKASATDEEIRDLYNELEIMTNVGDHPNLVNLLGACTQDGHLLVVLEIAENGNLLEYLKKSRETNQNYENIKSGGLTEEIKLRIATDVAKGMSHLAKCRCIHRDLAARNVLLGENYVAKVSDYGMARDVYEQLMYKKETQGKLPMKWMAIESLETYIFTLESDVWSFGVLLWEIESAGLKPYAGMNTTELTTALKKGYRLEQPAGCSDAMYQIMSDCWNANPKARPTFDELVARLENMAVAS